MYQHRVDLLTRLVECGKLRFIDSDAARVAPIRVNSANVHSDQWFVAFPDMDLYNQSRSLMEPGCPRTALLLIRLQGSISEPTSSFFFLAKLYRPNVCR